MWTNTKIKFYSSAHSKKASAFWIKLSLCEILPFFFHQHRWQLPFFSGPFFGFKAVFFFYFRCHCKTGPKRRTKAAVRYECRVFSSANQFFLSKQFHWMQEANFASVKLIYAVDFRVSLELVSQFEVQNAEGLLCWFSIELYIRIIYTPSKISRVYSLLYSECPGLQPIRVLQVNEAL